MKSNASLIFLTVLLAAIATVAQAGHFYTTNRAKRDNAIAQGYQAQGIVGYVFNKPSPSKRPSTGPIYHAYSSYSQDQSYTNSLDEHKHAISLGYQDMGISWYMYTKSKACRAPLYILFKPTFPYDHYYTAKRAEADAAIAKGYLERGILGYLYTDSKKQASPLYQLYKA
ncbi:hypothetical protein BGZ95_001635 [Linnemannia exigua]|uniref:DUF5648 domain-containing protein n=1 Tax=Linnemannia exigua TaxID=604196 RepID=A0AAD4D8D2_9FUNG|nr:hypothetical protein BGZ95_001635 [Linnemannia exigua]